MPDGVMRNIPPEILIPIFKYACTDVGHTGCSLSLVSRAFRRFCLDTGVDITSAAVCGASKLKAFLKMLRRRKPTDRRVNHLLLFPSRNGSVSWRIASDTNANRESYLYGFFVSYSALNFLGDVSLVV